MVNLNTNTEKNNFFPNIIDDKNGSKTESKIVSGRNIHHILSVTKLPVGNSSALTVAEILEGWGNSTVCQHQLLATRKMFFLT